MKVNIKKSTIALALLLLTVVFGSASVSASELPSVSYQTHVQNVGWQDYVAEGKMSGTEGMSYRLEGIRIALDDAGYDLGIQYQTHIQNIGWEEDAGRGWKPGKQMSGTEGLSYRLEAIQIKLTGADAEKFDIYYRVHAQNVGWMGWASNGAEAGTAGYGYRLEGIEIVIETKGDAAPGTTERAFLENIDIPILRTYENYYDDGSNKFGERSLYNSYYERPVLAETSNANININTKYDALETVWLEDNVADLELFIDLYNNDSNFKKFCVSPYFNEVRSSVSYKNNNLVSILQKNETWYGGFHPNTVTSSNTFNTKTGQELCLGDLLCISSSEISSKITPEFENLKNSDSKYNYVDFTEVSNSLNANSSYYLSDEGVCIYFNPYEVASYSMGMVQITIPYSRMDLLKPIKTLIP